MYKQLKMKIEQVIKNYSQQLDDQVNLASPGAQQDLAQAIVDEIQNTDISLDTYNEDQLELFSNIDQESHK